MSCCWLSRTAPKRSESYSIANPWCLEGVQICFLCDCMKLPVSSHPPGHLLSVHFHMIWFQDSIHPGMWLRNKTPWRAIVLGVMAASRGLRLSQSERLKCADSRPGEISLGLEMFYFLFVCFNASILSLFHSSKCHSLHLFKTSLVLIPDNHY